MSTIFGDKLRKLREVRGVSQQELARRMGYATNSYISDIEKGAFVPPGEDKLRQIARALDVPFELLKEMALESRLEDLGIREPGFRSLFKDYPKFTKSDRREIIKTYLKVRSAKRNQKDENGPNN
jgi:transcriptional regulator with XRE-family HTH domain